MDDRLAHPVPIDQSHEKKHAAEKEDGQAFEGEGEQGTAKALAASSPQGRARRTMRKKRRKGISVRPAIIQSRSSGKKGNRKVRIRKLSRFRSRSSR